jgi:pyruvate dehydrogenase E2 component (dihydrolipoamide acetyltransferase)
METGSISKWNLKEGDKFEVGTSFCEVETDKATVSFDATEEGYIAKILINTGDIKVGDPILVTVEDQASVAAFANFTVSASVAAPAAAPAAPAAAAPVAQAAPVAAPVPAASAPASSPSGGRVFASPLARKLAREAGNSIESIAAQLAASNSTGSGPNGRIVAADVLRASAMPKATTAAPAAVQQAAPVSQTSAAPASTAAPSSSNVSGVYSDFQLSELAQSLAARQTRAKQVVPHYYLSVELNLAELLKMRASFNATAAKSKKGASAELSVQDFLVKASAMAMQQVPDVNGAWMDTFVRRYDQVDINLVMGAGSFVATPVLRNVAARGLASLSAEIASFEDSLFADDATSSALLADGDKMAIGTFSIHNLGKRTILFI